MSENARGPKFDKKRIRIHPDGSWECPQCHTSHEHPHWKDHHQTQKVDKTFCDGFCKESDSQYEVDDAGLPKPLYCPKCSFEEDRLIIVKVKKGAAVYV